jgi:hypothetical protein
MLSASVGKTHTKEKRKQDKAITGNSKNQQLGKF